MGQDPLEVVRAAEQRIAERTDATARSTAAVDEAREDAARILAATREAAAAKATILTEDILAGGRADRQALLASLAARVAALRAGSAARRERDVVDVVRAVLPAPAGPTSEVTT